MLKTNIVLLQKQASPLRQELRDHLDGMPHLSLVALEALPLGLEPLGEAALFLWDLSGYGPQEREEMGQALAPINFGVVGVAGASEPGADQACQAAGALGLLLAPFSPAQLAATLEVALARQGQVWDLLAEMESLRREMANRPLIEQAKRVIMEGMGVSEAEAMRLLQRKSRSRNQKMVDTAQLVLEGLRRLRQGQ